MKSPKLDYYFFNACPFCQRVLNVIQENNIKVSYFDILSDQESLEKLLADTGRKTVPVLYIDDVPMHESSDIINWLRNNLEKLERTINGN